MSPLSSSAEGRKATICCDDNNNEESRGNWSTLLTHTKNMVDFFYRIEYISLLKQIPGLYRQLYWCIRKNWILIRKRPIMLFFLIFSSVLGVLFCLSTDEDLFNDFTMPPKEAFDNCGVYDRTREHHFHENGYPYYGYQYYWSIVPLQVGPVIQAIYIFMLVNSEVDKKLVGVIRSLGVRDTVYWASWYIPFIIISFLNSLLGAMTAKLVPMHMFESVYFMGIFWSLFLFQVALASASLFLASVCGSNGLLYVIVIPVILFSVVATIIYAFDDEHDNTTPLPWVYHNTRLSVWYGDESGVESFLQPIVKMGLASSNDQYVNLPLNEYFVGCYVTPGFTSFMWNPRRPQEFLMTAASYMIPSFHFLAVYSNFVGYIQRPGNTFDSQHAKMSPEDLATDAMPTSSNDENSDGTTLFPQGSTISIDRSRFRKDFDFEEKKCRSIDLTKHMSSEAAKKLERSRYCYYTQRSNPILNSPSVNDSLANLVLISLIYFVLALLWLKLFPNGNGRREKIFQKKARTNNNVDENYDCGRGIGYNVRIENVSKIFGTFEAVKDFTLELKKGQITALLGRNGAGKTTLTDILTFESNSSKGNINFFGHSITHDQETHRVKSMIGRCRQDDFLWPNLTVKEHLDIFAGLQGIPPLQHKRHVQKWLTSVDLSSHQHTLSSMISGGMRRRLSVALATIGDAPFLVFDEPTTGMDPESRRYVWRHLNEIKKDKVVLLTTHAMEEADVLADEVAIMKKGELVVQGSPLELKAKHCSAIQFDLLVEKGNADDIESSIKKILGQEHNKDLVQISKGDAGNMMVKVKNIINNVLLSSPSSMFVKSTNEGLDVQRLVRFVEWLEGEENPHVNEYSFCNSSLEEVFLIVTKDDEIEDVASSFDGDNSVTEISREDRNDDPETQHIITLFSEDNHQRPIPSFSKQVKAFLYLMFVRKWKNWRRFRYDAIFVCFLAELARRAGLDCYDDDFHTGLRIGLNGILLIIVLPLHQDKTTGLFHLMRTQGLLRSSYMIGTAIYAFLVQLVCGLIIVTPFYIAHFYSWGYNRQVVLSSSSYDDNIFSEKYEIIARPLSGGYPNFVLLALIFALLMPGATFVSLTLPSHYLNTAMVATGVVAFVALFLPLLIFDRSCGHSCEEYSELVDQFRVKFTTETAMNHVAYLSLGKCNVKKSMCSFSWSLIPDIGAYKFISLTLLSYVELSLTSKDTLKNNFKDIGKYCYWNICRLPLVAEMHSKNLRYFLYGVLLLNVVGIGSFTLCRFTPSFALKAKEAFKRVLYKRGWIKYAPMLHDHGDIDDFNDKCEEVIDEQIKVDEYVQSLDTGIRSNLPSVLMHGLRKVYPASGRSPPKVALKSLDLHVKKGEVCGLLGKNGSGKTTAFKILCCDHDASSGLTLVEGHDVSCEKMEVIDSVGNLAQFDFVWPSLTVQEHLYFFALLKGFSSDLALSKAESMAKAVGLGHNNVYNLEAGKLSGGMRRRLSIAIALLGGPDCLLLDEPSTGLDPSTRNQIWNVITSYASKERAIIISTHMMVEADTLCNRIAIIGQGRLKVVGTNQHLKDKYGSGYVLQLNLVEMTSECHNKAMAFVRKDIHCDARLDYVQAKTLHVHLPKDIKLSRVFLKLYSEECRLFGGINQFSLSQSSLEDVFLTLGD